MSTPQDRQISCFFAREFFWNYLAHDLDGLRVKQVDDHLKECHDCSSLLEREKISRNILKELSQVEPTPDVISFLHKEHKFWDDILENLGLSQSIETLKWIAQLSAVAFALILTVHFFPWLNLARSLQNLRPVTPSITVTKADKNIDADTASDKLLPPPQPRPEVFIGPRLPTPEELLVLKNKTVAKSIAEKEMDDTAPRNIPASGSAAEHFNGFVWRGSLKVDELSDELAERVTQIITDLGGRIAGKVELGWRKGDGFYYHFTLPEENYDKLMNELNTEGLVQLEKERHPRVMKAGYIRIIMTVEQNTDETR
jgi:hypothetical protein